MYPNITITDAGGRKLALPIPCCSEAYWRQLLRSYDERAQERGYTSYTRVMHDENVGHLRRESSRHAIGNHSQSVPRNKPAVSTDKKFAQKLSDGDAHTSAKGKTQIEILARHFHKPINDAAKDLNICATVLKKICRRHGLLRWPSRKLKSLKKVVETLQAQVANVPEEEKDKHASIMKRIRQAQLQVANTLLVQ